jgi:FCP1-like phosphatase family protein
MDSRKRPRQNDLNLVLVLDLDHTLLHASNNMPSLEELVEARKEGPPGPFGGGDGDVFRIDIAPTSPSTFWVKLRPGVCDMLRDLHELGYTLAVYTNATKEYAYRLLSCLDPEARYFGNRIITRDSNLGSEDKALRNLALRFNLLEEQMVVVDDRLDVWVDGAEQIVRVKPFFWFRDGTKRVGQLSAGKNRELPASAEEGSAFDDRKFRHMDLLRERLVSLAHVVGYMREHGDAHALPKDLGEAGCALRLVRGAVLQDLAICFSGVFHQNLANQQHPLWKEAERFGARCVTSINQATHLIMESSNTTAKYNDAMQLNVSRHVVHIVSLAWLIESLNEWRKQEETDYPPHVAKTSSVGFNILPALLTDLPYVAAQGGGPVRSPLFFLGANANARAGAGSSSSGNTTTNGDERNRSDSDESKGSLEAAAAQLPPLPPQAAAAAAAAPTAHSNGVKRLKSSDSSDSKPGQVVTLPRNMLMPTPSKPAAAQHIRPVTKVDTALAVTGAFGAPAGPGATVQLIRQQSATHTTSIQQDKERAKHNMSRLVNLAKKHGSRPLR